MKIKLNVEATIQKAMEITTTFGKFWTEINWPGTIAPAINYLLLLGVLSLTGSWLAGTMGVSTVDYSGFFAGLVYGIFKYAFVVAIPILLGFLLAALDPAMNIHKGDVERYTTVVAYAMTPAVLASLLIFIPFLGWLAGLAGFALTLAIAYIALTIGVELDSGQAVIFIAISLLTVFILKTIWLSGIAMLLVGGSADFSAGGF